MIKNIIHTDKFKLFFLFFAAFVVLFFSLGAKELWTQEWRWVNIPFEMLLRHDYLHPYLAGYDYYDKPLLSYWLILIFSYIFGGLKLWVVRLPSALSGFIVVCCIYKLGALNGRRTGFIAAWLLITTFAFVFWARVASADMLNFAGIMLALVWYFTHREKNNFLAYLIFFLILTFFSLCKGLSVCAIVFITLIPELILKSTWQRHGNYKIFLAFLICAFIYLLPFWLSAHFNAGGYGQSGLYEVLKENFVRYIKPFDHIEPFYVYFIYLPLYTFAWIILFIPSCIYACKNWRNFNFYSRWYFLALILIFLFFTLSGSRRHYYTLPMVAFVLLIVADWMQKLEEKYCNTKKIFTTLIAISFLFIFLYFCVLIPIYYSGGGLPQFGKDVRANASKAQSWRKWHIVMLDVKSRTFFYLQPTSLVEFIKENYKNREVRTYQELLQTYPILLRVQKNTILILKYKFVFMLQNECKEKDTCILNKYKIVFSKPVLGDRILKKSNIEDPVALIPI